MPPYINLYVRWYEILGTDSLSQKLNSSVAGEDPEGANRLFSRCEKIYFVYETI